MTDVRPSTLTPQGKFNNEIDNLFDGEYSKPPGKRKAEELPYPNGIPPPNLHWKKEKIKDPGGGWKPPNLPKKPWEKVPDPIGRPKKKIKNNDTYPRHDL